MKIVAAVCLSVLMFLSLTQYGIGQDFKKWEAQTAEHKQWLDARGPQGSGYWVRLDAKPRPHRLYVGEGFFRTDPKSQERFVEVYSSYLAGHPEKFMLIDLYDAKTNRPVGEFGWAGFKLYAEGTLIIERIKASLR